MTDTDTLTRTTATTTKPLRRQCAACGRPFVQRSARPQRYCSTRCRVAAYRQAAPELPLGARNEWAAGVVAPPSEITAPQPRPIPEVPANADSLHRQKAGGSVAPIAGPAAVVEIEVFGARVWRSVISPDGVTCEVSTLRRRALFGGVS